jgi:hypothetical protein
LIFFIQNLRFLSVAFIHRCSIISSSLCSGCCKVVVVVDGQTIITAGGEEQRISRRDGTSVSGD